MKKQYVISMFFLCFFIWAIVVDNAVLPPMNSLKQDVGEFSRYRVKKWNGGGKLDLLRDQLLIYAVVENREQLYYIECKPYFEQTLKNLPKGARIQLRYVHRFPKFWKRNLYDLRESGQSILSYSSGLMIQKQKEIWKFTGTMGGIFIFLALLGFINKPQVK